MTLITAITSDDGRSIGMVADRIATSGGGRQRLLGTSKIWATPHALIGVAGSLRISQIIRAGINPKPIDGPVEAWAAELTADIYDALDNYDALSKGDEGISHLGGFSDIIVATDTGHLFVISCDFSWDEHTMWTAIGSGADHFEGAYGATGDEDTAWRITREFIAIGEPADRLTICVGP